MYRKLICGCIFVSLFVIPFVNASGFNDSNPHDAAEDALAPTALMNIINYHISPNNEDTDLQYEIYYNGTHHPVFAHIHKSNDTIDITESMQIISSNLAQNQAVIRIDINSFQNISGIRAISQPFIMQIEWNGADSAKFEIRDYAFYHYDSPHPPITALLRSSNRTRVNPQFPALKALERAGEMGSFPQPSMQLPHDPIADAASALNQSGIAALLRSNYNRSNGSLLNHLSVAGQMGSINVTISKPVLKLPDDPIADTASALNQPGIASLLRASYNRSHGSLLNHLAESGRMGDSDDDDRLSTANVTLSKPVHVLKLPHDPIADAASALNQSGMATLLRSSYNRANGSLLNRLAEAGQMRSIKNSIEHVDSDAEDLLVFKVSSTANVALLQWILQYDRGQLMVQPVKITPMNGSNHDAMVAFNIDYLIAITNHLLILRVMVGFGINGTRILSQPVEITNKFFRQTTTVAQSRLNDSALHTGSDPLAITMRAGMNGTQLLSGSQTARIIADNGTYPSRNRGAIPRKRRGVNATSSRKRSRKVRTKSGDITHQSGSSLGTTGAVYFFCFATALLVAAYGLGFRFCCCCGKATTDKKTSMDY